MDASEPKTSGFPVVLGKFAYGAVFILFVPLLLVAWAYLTNDIVQLSLPASPLAGDILTVLGAALMLAGMWAIYVYGHGLPMNAFPPSRFVVESVYRYLAHPIYVGFSMICFGVSLIAKSSSGFWLVAPIATLGCVALVVGYEREATSKHFGGVRPTPLLRIPTHDSQPATVSERMSSFLIAIVPLALFTIITNSIANDLGDEFVLRKDSVVVISSWQIIFYWTSIAIAALVPFFVQTRLQLRDFTISVLVAIGIAAVVFVAFPYSEPIAFDNSGLIAFYENKPNIRTVAALALNLAFILLAARTLWAARRRFATYAVCGLALAVAFGGSAIGVYGPIELILGPVIYGLAGRINLIWDLVRRLAERIANSWTEWRLGSVRVINHGFYAAFGSFVSLSVIGVLAGAENVPYVILITFLAITISGLTAQWIEGSPKLLRPFGWYGGIVGGFTGVAIVHFLGANTFLLVAAFCVGAPFVQAAGRVRCLVQGCCHGRRADEAIGIRYQHPLSRVCRIADLKDLPLHATQLYSIGYNALVAIIGLRLWIVGSSLSLIVGVYFILTGMGRFIEESYRGEPQTPVSGGLRIYQIFAIISVVGGMGATMIAGTGNAPLPVFNWDAIVASAAFAVFVWIAFGVDFPHSNRRFARLT